MKLATLGIPLLLVLALFFYLTDRNKTPPVRNGKTPEATSATPAVTQPSKPKRKPEGYGECMWLSDQEYKREMAKFDWIRRQPEVNYGRLRDDRYGKGLNTITREKLDRERQCLEGGFRE